MENPNKIEVLVDAISFARQAYRPDSLAYRIKNPILLKNFASYDVSETKDGVIIFKAKNGKYKRVTEDGFRVFDTLVGGYTAALDDIRIKVSGRSNSHLTPQSHLRNLLCVMGLNQESDQVQVVSFLKKATRDPSIGLSTPLSYFEQKQEKQETE